MTRYTEIKCLLVKENKLKTTDLNRLLRLGFKSWLDLVNRRTKVFRTSAALPISCVNSEGFFMRTSSWEGLPANVTKWLSRRINTRTGLYSYTSGYIHEDQVYKDCRGGLCRSDFFIWFIALKSFLPSLGLNFKRTAVLDQRVLETIVKSFQRDLAARAAIAV